MHRSGLLVAFRPSNYSVNEFFPAYAHLAAEARQAEPNKWDHHTNKRRKSHCLLVIMVYLKNLVSTFGFILPEHSRWLLTK